jgi:hypothetical protein
MLLTTLCTKTLPILLRKQTKNQDPLFLVFSKNHPNQVSFSTSGHWDQNNEYLFWDQKEERTVYDITCPQYASLLDEQFTSEKAIYSPTALLSAGFLTTEIFSQISEVVVQSLATLGNIELDPGFDHSGFYRARLFSKSVGKTHHLPGSTLAEESKSANPENK